MWYGHLGQIKIGTNRVELSSPEARLIHAVPYCYGAKAQKAGKAKTDKMPAIKFIELAQTKWAAIVALVRKHDKNLLFCVENRRLSALTTRNLYSSPRMIESIESFGDTKIFSASDANSGYWQIVVHKSNCENISFSSQYALNDFTRRSFGLRSAPAIFQCVMDVTLSSVKWQYFIVYLQDIVIF